MTHSGHHSSTRRAALLKDCGAKWKVLPPSKKAVRKGLWENQQWFIQKILVGGRETVVGVSKREGGKV